MKFYEKGHIKISVLLLSGILLFAACQKAAQETSTSNSFGPAVNVVYLVSDNNSLYPASRTDSSLQDAWGIAIGPTGNIWVASSGKGISTVYNGTGASIRNPVAITSATKSSPGHPTGIVFNNTTDFVIPSSGSLAKFIFAGLEGSITAWNSGDSTVTVASKSGASYTGLTLANDGTGNYLFAANFIQGTIDVLDKNFNFVSGRSFLDPALPSGFAPYNIQNIGGSLYITYALTGTGGYGYGNNLGYISIFNPDGTFIRRFASGGMLADPWGIVQAPAALGYGQNMILVGNFIYGTISIYDANGTYKGAVSSSGVPIVIPGLWALVTAPSTASNLDPDAVYFAAGPGPHVFGIFGYIKRK